MPREYCHIEDNRDFHAERPNQKWVTDISYIKTGQGVLYLSVIRDLYDNSIVAYKTGTEQNSNLVLSAIRAAKRKEKVTAELQLHSDQGFQYTSQAYYSLTKSYHITPSMSRRGNPYDNALAENFFSILKTECIYRAKISIVLYVSIFSWHNKKPPMVIVDNIYLFYHRRLFFSIVRFLRTCAKQPNKRAVFYVLIPCGINREAKLD